MPFDPPHNSPVFARKCLSALWRGARWTGLRVVRITHYAVYKIFIRNERISSRMLAPTLNADDLKFLIIGTLLLLAMLNVLYWTKVIGIHR